MTDDPHLDLLELDALRGGDAPTAAQRAHLAWCAPCRAALAELAALATDLRRAVPDGAIPAEREAAILAAARRRAAVVTAQGRPRRQGSRLVAARWAAAAVLVVAIATLTALQRGATPDLSVTAAPAARVPLNAAQADLDGDGLVTVLDAFALARAVTRGTPRLGDADRRDVDLILAMAVALDRPRAEAK